ncbi:F0F1 ATP synthase subunit gamma [Candidatus Babeliales bacterium]|nr:F0F1 ATP synthase subunit gamma [Candidatus Babeliales bacterium]
MSQLIQMRQRLKAVETIRKITHAMQLVSMSTHLQFRNRKQQARLYHDELQALLLTSIFRVPTWTNHILMPSASTKPKTLLILVGSQKGLCGTFNTGLLNDFDQLLSENNLYHADAIIIGKKMIEHINARRKTLPLNIIAQHDAFTASTISALITYIIGIIEQTQEPYTLVQLYTNHAITFFLQEHRLSTLIPFQQSEEVAPSQEDEMPYWHQEPNDVLDALALQYLKASINNIFVQSLLSEQAARFVSMDSATRNARSLLDTMRLQYNKLRQAKITKELIELTSSF